jgi:nitroreductase/ferredoxin
MLSKKREVIMSLFTVDSEKCKRDGICADTCPPGVITFENKDKTPVPVAGAEESCIFCGHCVAVCPHGALSHKAMSPDNCQPIEKGLGLKPEQARQLFRARRSIRVYQDRPVPRDILSDLIRTATYAPSGHNVQPTHWLVFYGSTEVRRLSDLTVAYLRIVLEEKPGFAKALHVPEVIAAWEAGQDHVFRGAPHVVLCHAPADERTAPMGCVIALTYLELAAAALGLGTCWTGYFNEATEKYPPMKEALRLPEGHKNFGAMTIGYPKYRYQRIPLRNEPRITWR